MPSRVARRCYDAPGAQDALWMSRREFTSQTALQHHAKLTGDFYAFEGAATFAKWRSLLTPNQYELVDVRTSQGVRGAMLFPKRILLGRVGSGCATTRSAGD